MHSKVHLSREELLLPGDLNIEKNIFKPYASSGTRPNFLDIFEKKKKSRPSLETMHNFV